MAAAVSASFWMRMCPRQRGQTVKDSCTGGCSSGSGSAVGTTSARCLPAEESTTSDQVVESVARGAGPAIVVAESAHASQAAVQQVCGEVLDVAQGMYRGSFPVISLEVAQ